MPARARCSANNVVTSYFYDGLGRPKSDSAGSLSHVYDWDSVVNGIGKIGRITASDPDGIVLDFSYDGAGRSTDKSWTVDGRVFKVTHQYDVNGRLKEIDYPSFSDRRLGVVLNYSPTGELSSLTDTTGAIGVVERLAERGVVVRALPGKPWVRASVGAWNSDEDLDRVLDAGT